MPSPPNIERVPTLLPMTTMQYAVAVLLGLKYTYGEVATALGISGRTVRFHTVRAADRIPGDLPTQMKVMAWARGASLDVLEGNALYIEVRRERTAALIRNPKLGR